MDSNIPLLEIPSFNTLPRRRTLRKEYILHSLKMECYHVYYQRLALITWRLIEPQI